MSEDISTIMGFSGFGRQKKAKSFNVEEMFEKSRRTAQEYSAQVKAKQFEDEGNDRSDEEEIGPPLPLTLQHTTEEEELVGPPVPSGYDNRSGHSIDEDNSEDEDDNMEEEEEDFYKRFPISHEVILHHGTKPVSAMGLDPAGARLLTGGYDCELKFWDFAGMDSSLQSFRSMHPCESHQICSLQYSNTGDMILIGSGSAQAKVLDRDGHNVMECPKGWQYISDMNNTNGHISMINGACWHPRIKEQFLTCSNDCTIRIWDVYQKKKQLDVLKAKDKHGRKTGVTTCAFSRDGKLIGGAMQNGSIQLWNSTGPFVRSSITNHTAHTPGQDTSCLCFAHDNNTLISRGGDDTLKLWDIRKFRSPVKVVNDLKNLFSVTDCVFSPDEKLIVTGTSIIKGQNETGNLLFYDRELNEVYKLPVSNSSVIRCLWHPKIHQIFVGCGDGSVKILFSDKNSQRGAKMFVAKHKRMKVESITSAGPRIVTPHALPLFKEEGSKSLKRKREKERKDPVSSHQPELPIAGKGAGGRIGAGGSSIGAYMRKIAAIEGSIDKDEDPREAILKYAKVASESPFWINPAYKSTQPKPVFQDGDSDEEDNETKDT